MGDGFDCKVMIQPNPGWGIMVTLRMDAAIFCAEPMLSSCFDEGPLLDRQTNLDFLVLG